MLKNSSESYGILKTPQNLVLKNNVNVCKTCIVCKDLFKDLAGWNLELIQAAQKQKFFYAGFYCVLHSNNIFVYGACSAAIK